MYILLTNKLHLCIYFKVQFIKMNLKLTFFFFLFYSLTTASAQNLSVAEAQKDILYFRKKMKDWHPGIGYYQSEEVYEKTLDSIAASITKPIHYLAFYRTLLPIQNAVQDGHFGIYHHKKFNLKKQKLLPFYPKKVDDRFFIWTDVTADSSLQRGTEILKINGQEIGTVFNLLTSKYRIGNDGPENYGANQQVQNNFPLFYAYWFGSKDTVLLTYKLNDTSQVMERKFPCHIPAIQRQILASRKTTKPNFYPNLSLRMVDSIPKTAILYVNSFSGIGKYDMFGIRFRKRTKKAFRMAKENGIENLIVDFRNNGGGAVSNCENLLRYLLKERFELMGSGVMKKKAARPYNGGFGIPTIPFLLSHRYDENGKVWRNKKHKRPRKKPKKTYHFDQNVYFLTNGGSFSGGAATPSLAHSRGIGTIVGEPTGGAYLGCFGGKYKYITLPNSKIRVRIPLKKINYSVENSKNIGVTLKPDYLIERTIDDVKNSNDVALKFVFELIEKANCEIINIK
jgi:Peptidase family S41